jgi:hypothetical protein
VFTIFNMEHPVVGGYTPEKVALRRAIFLAYDVQREIDQPSTARAGVRAQSMINPLGQRLRPEAFRSEMPTYSPAAGQGAAGPVRLHRPRRRRLARAARRPAAGAGDARPSRKGSSRQLDELWKKNMDAVGIARRLQARASGPRT